MVTTLQKIRDAPLLEMHGPTMDVQNVAWELLRAVVTNNRAHRVPKDGINLKWVKKYAQNVRKVNILVQQGRQFVRIA